MRSSSTSVSLGQDGSESSGRGRLPVVHVADCAYIGMKPVALEVPFRYLALHDNVE
jgi:hypothetical protein